MNHITGDHVRKNSPLKRFRRNPPHLYFSEIAQIRSFSVVMNFLIKIEVMSCCPSGSHFEDHKIEKRPIERYYSLTVIGFRL